jgi:hypothetical protein
MADGNVKCENGGAICVPAAESATVLRHQFSSDCAHSLGAAPYGLLKSPMRKPCLMTTESISECAIITKDFSVVMSSISPMEISCLAKICEPRTICERSRPIWSCILLEYRASKLDTLPEQAHILHGDWSEAMAGSIVWGMPWASLQSCCLSELFQGKGFVGVHMCWKPDTPGGSAFRPSECITASYSILTICLRRVRKSMRLLLFHLCYEQGGTLSPVPSPRSSAASD